MICCPMCNEAEFYHWQPGYCSWCERCGYVQDAGNIGTCSEANEEPRVQEGR